MAHPTTTTSSSNSHEISPTALVKYQVETEYPANRSYIDVEFFPEAARKFAEYFTPHEISTVLRMLVDHADDAVSIEIDGVCWPPTPKKQLKQLTIFGVHFRFSDLRDAGCLLVDSLHRADEDPPPPSNKRHAIRDAVISGGVSGLIRWTLGEIFHHLFLHRQPIVAKRLFVRSAAAARRKRPFLREVISYRRVEANFWGGGGRLISLKGYSPDLVFGSHFIRRPLHSSVVNRILGASSRFELRCRPYMRRCDLLSVSALGNGKSSSGTAIAMAFACNVICELDMLGSLTLTKGECRNTLMNDDSETTSWRIEMPTTIAVQPNAIDATSEPIEPSVTTVNGEMLTTYRVPISRNVDIRAIRKSLSMTQEKFAQMFGLSLASLRNWEQGTRIPERPIALYLRLIEKYPTEVMHEVELMRSHLGNDA